MIRVSHANGSVSSVAIFCLPGSDAEEAGGKCIFGNINSFYSENSIPKLLTDWRTLLRE